MNMYESYHAKVPGEIEAMEEVRAALDVTPVDIEMLKRRAVGAFDSNCALGCCQCSHCTARRWLQEHGIQ